MGHTQSRWTGDTPASDMRIFVGATEFLDVAAHATVASAGTGLFTLNLAAGLAGTFFANLSSLLRRTGSLAAAGPSQQQFGTAAGVPGPSGVAGTSGPLAQSGYPGAAGWVSATNPTLLGPATEPLSKGMQINSVDVIYSVLTVNAALATIGLTKTKFSNLVAPVVTNLIALGANGLPVAFNAAGPNVKTVTVLNPSMLTDLDSETILNINLTAGAGGTVVFYGAELGVSFNHQ